MTELVRPDVTLFTAIFLKGGGHCHALLKAGKTSGRLVMKNFSGVPSATQQFYREYHRIHRQAAPVPAFFVTGFSIEFP